MNKEGRGMDAVHSLFKAVYDGDGAAIARLLASNATLARARDASSLSVLRFAAFMRREPILDALVTAGPPLDLHEAAMLDRPDRINETLDATPAAVNDLSSDGFTALHMASFFGALSAAAALLDRGADVNTRTQNFLSNMPLHAAAAGSGDIISICTLLLERGADPNVQQQGGFRPLHSAGHRGSRDLVELLLTYHADPALTNDDGETPGDSAASQGHMEVAAMLRAAATRG